MFYFCGSLVFVYATSLEGNRPEAVALHQPGGLSIKSLNEASGVKNTWLIRPGVTPCSSTVPTGCQGPTAWYKSPARNMGTSPGL